jgi:hypothetical protein
MSVHSQLIDDDPHVRDAPPIGDTVCPECAERTCLASLVAELIYKNQPLRLRLAELQAQFEEARGDRRWRD